MQAYAELTSKGKKIGSSSLVLGTQLGSGRYGEGRGGEGRGGEGRLGKGSGRYGEWEKSLLQLASCSN